MMEIVPTRSALLELKDDRVSMAEGYRFLDEKRLLLAAEIVRVQAQYKALRADYQETQRLALATLAAAVARHGLEGVQLYPAEENGKATIQRHERLFFGVLLVEATLDTTPTSTPAANDRPNVNPSPEAEACRHAFFQLMAQSVPLAALASTLYRLLFEYRRTERRARALEDVILPELTAAITEIDTRLEELEQEEAVRVRLGGVAVG